MDRLTYSLRDNMSVIHNTQRPESVLKKKSIAICYHFMRASPVAMGECLTAHIVRSEDNPEQDLCTKVMPGGQKRDRLVDMVLHYSTKDSNASSVKTTMSVKMLEQAKQLIKDHQEKKTSSRPGRTG
jgi:hypothetical protein